MTCTITLRSHWCPGPRNTYNIVAIFTARNWCYRSWKTIGYDQNNCCSRHWKVNRTLWLLYHTNCDPFTKKSIYRGYMITAIGTPGVGKSTLHYGYNHSNCWSMHWIGNLKLWLRSRQVALLVLKNQANIVATIRTVSATGIRKSTLHCGYDHCNWCAGHWKGNLTLWLCKRDYSN